MTLVCYGCLTPTDKLLQVYDNLRCDACVTLLFEQFVLEKEKGFNAIKGFVKFAKEVPQQ